MKPRLRISLALVILGGCASAPPNRYFALSAAAPTSAALNGSVLRLVSVLLPGLTDRPQMVVRTGANAITVQEFDRWAEPLDDMVRRVLSEDLAARRSPTASAPAVSLHLMVDEFMVDGDGRAVLAGRWTALPPPPRDAAMAADHPFALELRHAPGGPERQAAELSRLLGHLADEIARSTP